MEQQEAESVVNNTVDDVVKRVDRTKETKMLHRIVTLVAVGMLLCAWIIPRFTWRPMFAAIGILAGILWFLS